MGARRQQRYATGIGTLDARALRHEMRRWNSLCGAGFRYEFGTPSNSSVAAAYPIIRRSLELQILAPSQHRADYAAILLYAAASLIECGLPGSMWSDWDPYDALPAISSISFQSHAPRTVTISSVDYAGLAASLSRRRHLAVASTYFLASIYSAASGKGLFNVSPLASQLSRHPNPVHRIWEAQALFAAFQAIEALNLTIVGAGPTKQSVTEGKWDSSIRLDIEDRLLGVGIAPSDLFVWRVRGRATAIHKKLRSRTAEARATAWREGVIQDKEMPYCDAINRAQWLRSNVAAHKSSRWLPQLHPIDVANVQHLARSLIMCAARFPWWSHS